jgi:capsular exopolysaccharide synthesis family protein
MSKFFDDTQKAQQWTSNEIAVKTEAQEVLESLRQGDTAGRAVADVRLRACRRIKLPNLGTPLISYNGKTPGKSDQVATECYRALRTRLLRQQGKTGLRSVVVSSSFAGEGKTLTALNLALASAGLADQRVLLVDADLRTRGLTKLLGEPQGSALPEALSGSVAFADVVLATDLPNLHVVTGGTKSLTGPEPFTGARWKEFLGWCGESFKLILVDSPPVFPLTDFELISAACDGILFVVKALQTKRQLLRRAAGQLDSKKVVGVVFNGAPMGGSNKGYFSYYHG